MSKTDIKCERECERECERDGVRCRHYETGLGSMCGACGDYDLWEAPPPPEQKVHSRGHLVIHDDSASVMADCNSEDTADKIVLAWNSHYKLVDALREAEELSSSGDKNDGDAERLLDDIHAILFAALADVADAATTQDQPLQKG